MRGRGALGSALVALLVLGSDVAAHAHATFPATQNAQGTAAAPYPGQSARYVVLRVPEERAGPPKLDNVDVKVEIPAGWSGATCDPALTASGSAPGPVAGGWTCSLEPGTPDVLHWTRAPGATDLGVYFPFSVTTGRAGTFGFVVHQTYSSGEVVVWNDAAVPPCTGETNEAGTACAHPAPSRVVGERAAKGYWLAASDGGVFNCGVFNYGDAGFHGSAGGTPLSAPIVGMAATPSGQGYWLVGSDGGVFNYGDAGFYGSTGATSLNAPVVGMAATPSGRGYWLVAADGGIFNYGDAGFFGSAGSTRLNAPVTGMAAHPSGRGYWLVATDGGIFNYGDAGFYGSTGATRLSAPIAAVTATATGRGYRMTATDGGIFAYGDAAFYGSGQSPAAPGQSPATPGAQFVGAALTPSGNGYWLATTTGTVRNFGDATPFGWTGPLNRPLVGLASLP